MTAGCAQFSAPAPLAVQVPDDCLGLMQPVPPPRLVPNEDLGVRSAKFAAALGQANGRLAASAECNQLVIDAFKQEDRR